MINLLSSLESSFLICTFFLLSMETRKCNVQNLSSLYPFFSPVDVTLKRFAKSVHTIRFLLEDIFILYFADECNTYAFKKMNIYSFC